MKTSLGHVFALAFAVLIVGLFCVATFVGCAVESAVVVELSPPPYPNIRFISNPKLKTRYLTNLEELFYRRFEHTLGPLQYDNDSVYSVEFSRFDVSYEKNAGPSGGYLLKMDVGGKIMEAVDTEDERRVQTLRIQGERPMDFQGTPGELEASPMFTGSVLGVCREMADELAGALLFSENQDPIIKPR